MLPLEICRKGDVHFFLFFVYNVTNKLEQKVNKSTIINTRNEFWYNLKLCKVDNLLLEYSDSEVNGS